jgi:hypothetical protein
MPRRTWHVYCLRTEDAVGSLEEVGIYRDDEVEEVKSDDTIKVDADGYRVVFFVHIGPTRGGGNLVVVPTA